MHDKNGDGSLFFDLFFIYFCFLLFYYVLHFKKNYKKRKQGELYWLYGKGGNLIILIFKTSVFFFVSPEPGQPWSRIQERG